MLRYEKIIKDYLEANNVKLLSMQDNRILVEIEKEQKIYRVEKLDNSLIIKNVYSDLLYQIELR